ncbi:uncharacterized protein LOC126779497 [Nymphalis io]|uniref:uncharacterized protein LOC126779497 n=1 Tax=Inachis io TaxID=171585 RepID=UPI002166C6D9|nr:uncharacterized protein LOC126779497 [Nymphalis io]XP_050359478.1 uncharacterized protein LOC126779497 [Nymphalis io]XP_050359479.1 uncharacterized protein LOC126779497 [Nymphalis io]
MATSDITFQDGNFKHPYLLALVRWCVSSFWTTATVILHRIITAPIPPIKATKVSKTRPASSDHLHPEPKVECVVLHTPAEPTLDVIFVHGLYGSLGNTWRQGEWMTKYDKLPTKMLLRRPHSRPTCKCPSEPTNCFENENTLQEFTNNGETNAMENKMAADRMNTNVYKKTNQVLPQDNYFAADTFYNNKLLQQVNIGNYETQAQFVKDMFESDAREKKASCECNGKECNGCGCVCDECYSPCWPRDWIRVDYPGARVISINYTSDPYLWRPLWIREIKRLRLHDRADQMITQLLELGVGERPIVWVGHSKGGLFIKQIYCEAYDAHLKTTKTDRIITKYLKNEQYTIESKNDNRINHCIDADKQTDGEEDCDKIICDSATDNDFDNALNSDILNNNEVINSNNEDICELDDNNVENKEDTENSKDQLIRKARLWTNSTGFMFYSVPHRGSPLADIKTPITARSIELMEICKDCNLVLNLQERWLQAVSSTQPAVRSLVETCRTLMSVLYLRIVSVDSADPGIGTLYGVSVDHREICKPSSRECLLYKELMTLMEASLNKHRQYKDICDSNKIDCQ